MATRTSSRQAAQKAKEAIAAAPDTKSRASTKRKDASEKGPQRKKEKKDDHKPAEEEVMKEAPKQAEKERQPEEVEKKQSEVEEKKQSEEEKGDSPDEHEPEEKHTKDEEQKEPQETETATAASETEDKGKDSQQESAPEPVPEPAEEVKEEKPSEAAPEKADDKPKAEEESAKDHPEPTDAQGSAAEKSEDREKAVPSNILEKGIIYFFFRPRVNVSDPQSVSDIARSFFVLRPTAMGAVFNEHGPTDGSGKCRLVMLPKKKYPTSARERDMAFVEKADASLKQLQESFIAGETYETETRGERTVPEARPYAEGVYAITRTKRASHLAYMLTIPDKMGPVQEDFGLSARGSFIVQSKNPKHPGPSFAQLPKEPEYPESIREKFGDYRWIPVEPEFLDYANAQILMIGEAHEALGKAGEAEPGDKKPEEHQPGEELEKLEEENEERVDRLRGDDTVYEDLGYHANQHPKVPTTWG